MKPYTKLQKIFLWNNWQRLNVTLCCVLFLLLSALSSPVFAQPTNTVAGEWVVDWTTMESKMTVTEKARFDGMPETVRDRARTSFSSRTYNFQSDGSAEIGWQSANGTRNASGTWELTGNELIIQVGEQQQTFHITFEGDNLLLSPVSVSSAAVFSTIVLKPQP